MGINEKTREKMRSMYNSGYTCDEISKVLGIAESIVRKVVLG